MEQLDNDPTPQNLTAYASQTPTMLELAREGVPPHSEEFFKRLGRSGKDFGLKPVKDRNPFERLLNNLAKMVGLQDPVEAQALEQQKLLTQAYLPIYARERGEPSALQYQTAQGNVTPPIGGKSATVEAGGPAGLIPNAPVPAQPPQVLPNHLGPPVSPSPIPNAVMPPASLSGPLAGVGVPLPPPGPATIMGQQGQSFNDYLKSSDGSPEGYAAWQASQSLPIEPPTMPTGPMLGALPPLRAGMPVARPPMFVNGAPAAPNQLDAMANLHAPVNDLTHMYAQSIADRHLRAAVEEQRLGREERTNEVKTVNTPENTTTTLYTGKGGGQIINTIQGKPDPYRHFSSEFATLLKANKLDPANPTDIAKGIEIEKAAKAKVAHDELVYKQAGELANQYAGHYIDQPQYAHLKASGGPLYSDLNAKDRLQVTRDTLAYEMQKTSGTQKPLGEEMIKEIAGMDALQAVFNDIRDLGPDRLAKYVGPIDVNIRKFMQPALRDENFSKYRAVVAQILVAQFAVAGKNFTEGEKQTLKAALPTGNELTLSDFMAKLNEAEKQLQIIKAARIYYASTPRDQLQGATPQREVTGPPISEPGAFKDPDKERRYQNWKKTQQP